MISADSFRRTCTSLSNANVNVPNQEQEVSNGTVVQYLDISVEADKNVLQERSSEGMRDEISWE